MIKHNFIIKGLILGLFFIISSLVFASTQDYRYQKAFKVQQLSIKEGLSQSVVQDIIQDQDGYIWLATEDGLNRFDSYEFKIFRHDHKDIHSLHENSVVSLVEEPGHGIWIGTGSGPSFYNPNSNQFTDYSQENLKLKTRISFILFSKSLNQVLFASNKGLYYFDRDQDAVLPFMTLNGRLFDMEIDTLAEDEIYLYVATNQCLYSISKLDKKVINLCDTEALAFLKMKKINVLSVKNNHLWIGTTEGLFRFNTHSQMTKSFIHDENDFLSISDDYIQDIKFSEEQGLWISTTEGLNYYDESKERFKHYKKQFYFDEGLSSNDIVSLHIDQQNLIWLGTYGGGVNILDPNQQKFEQLLTRTEVIDKGNNNTIHGIEKDKYETLWLASYGGGLLSYNQLTGSITRPLDQQKIAYNHYVWAVNIDYLERLWVGTLSELVLVNVKNKTKINIVILIDDQLTDSFKSINRIYEDQDGVTWLGLDKGLFKVTNTEMKNGTLYINMSDFTPRLPKSYTDKTPIISSIIHDQRGDYWFGGPAGLLFYKVKENEWLHYYYDKNNSQSLSNDFVQAIYEDSHGFIWVGTGDGLSRVVFSGVNNSSIYFERITTDQGLSNNSIYSILEDDEQQLWLSSNLGVMKYSNNQVDMELYRKVDGLSSDEFNLGAYYSDSEGNLYLGSINGITIINNSKNKIKKSSKTILFTKAFVDNRELDIQKLNKNSEVTIIVSATELSVNLQVANLNFDKLGTQKYRYRLIGLNNEWHYLGSKRSILLAGLNEGTYKLEVQSQLTGMLWNGHANKINIIVQASFWNSLFAYYLIVAIVFILFITIIYFTARHFKKQIQRTKIKLKMESLRVKALKLNNQVLKKSLNEKEQEVVSLHRRVETVDQQLDVEKYRDVTTGFYHISYLYRIYENLTDSAELNKLVDFSLYKEIMVLELNNYNKIHHQKGPLISAELLAKVSALIRKKTDAELQIYYIQNGQFLILGAQVARGLFQQSLLALSHLIDRSEFELANGVYVNTLVSATFMETTESNMASKDDLVSVVNLLVQSHRFINENNKAQLNRIKIKSAIFTLLEQNTHFDFEALENQNLIFKETLK